MLDDFACAFGDADRVLAVDIYAARETDTLGVSSALLAERIGKKAVAAGDVDGAAKILLDEVTPNDAVIIMGAGDIYRIYRYLPLEN